MIVEEFPLELRSRLLAFVSGSQTPPALGFERLPGFNGGVVKFTLTIARVEAMEIDQRAIYKLIFLDRRAQALCGAGADGVLRFWNVKSYGECVWEQHAGHAPGEAVVALATDAKNTMLFSGDSAG